MPLRVHRRFRCPEAPEAWPKAVLTECRNDTSCMTLEELDWFVAVVNEQLL